MEVLPELCDPPKTLYLQKTPKGGSEDLMLFMVPKVHWAMTLKSCHRYAGHQGHDCTLVFTTGVLLVALDGQPDMTSYQKLYTLFTA